MIRFFILAFFLVFSVVIDPGYVNAAGIVATIKVGNTPDGVAVNTKTNEIAVANSKSNTISVINGETNKVTSNINVAGGPNMVYFMEAPSEIYATCENGDILSLIDAATNEVGAEISISRPSGIALDEGTGQTYVISETSGTVSLFDFLTRNVLDTVSVGQKPKQIAINPNTYYGYVTNFDSDSVTIIDERGVAGSRTSSIMLGGAISVGNGPSGVAVNLTTDKVYVTNVNSNTITEIDSKENKVTGTLSISKGKGIFNIAVDPARGELYVTSQNTNELLILDPSGNVLETVKVGSKPSGVAVNSGTGRIYVANSGSDTLTVIDVTKEETATPGQPKAGGKPKDAVDKLTEIIDSFVEAKNELDEIRNSAAKQLAAKLAKIIRKLEVLKSQVGERCVYVLTTQQVKMAKVITLLESKRCSTSDGLSEKSCVPQDVADMLLDELQTNLGLYENFVTGDKDNNENPDICDLVRVR